MRRNRLLPRNTDELKAHPESLQRVRGFESHPPHHKRSLSEIRSRVFNTLLWMKREGYPESTIKTTARRLKHLAKHCDLEDPEAVKEFIAAKEVSEGYKRNLVNEYTYYVRAQGRSWKRPRYQRTKRIPKVPSKEALEKIIARATWRYATCFSILRDTGMAPAELHKTRLRDVDLERGVIQAPGLKGHQPRVLKLKPSTLAMLKRYLAEHSGEYPFPTRKQMYDAWRYARNKLADSLQDPTLRTIRLYDLRHYFGTMLYHKTKDILYTKQQMGHSRIQTTLIYAQLIDFAEDEWTSAAATTVEEFRELVEKGFEYVGEVEGAKIFRKPKL